MQPFLSEGHILIYGQNLLFSIFLPVLLFLWPIQYLWNTSSLFPICKSRSGTLRKVVGHFRNDSRLWKNKTPVIKEAGTLSKSLNTPTTSVNVTFLCAGSGSVHSTTRPSSGWHFQPLSCYGKTWDSSWSCLLEKLGQESADKCLVLGFSSALPYIHMDHFLPTLIHISSISCLVL